VWEGLAVCEMFLVLGALPAGPRVCLGQRLAELEAVYVLTGLLAQYSFKQVVPGSKVDYALSSTMPMKQGLHVFVQERGRV
jgi:cytochrome P450